MFSNVQILFWSKIIAKNIQILFLFNIVEYVHLLPALHGYQNFARFSQISTVFNLQQETCHPPPKRLTLLKLWGRGCSVGLVTTSRGRKWHARASTQAKSQIIGSLSSMSFFPSSSYLISCSRKSSVLLSFPMAATFHFDCTNGNIGNERVILSRIETFLFCCKWQQVPFLDIEVFVRVKLPITEILDFVDWHNIYMKY